ncbi:DUF559 domain-containing protein [uncultured Microbacterium sp.]|uniref:endonuclease domain-containing protein n=1 Tax=uncultured Microbacterium sp. TaxID=191216 RepID=UPI002635C7FB|nr:DUF559 domain-containing protein [uncultured Microbacterium sp.]
MFEVWTRAELRAEGINRREINQALVDRVLIRVRKGHYVRGDAPDALIRAGRVGGRLGCVSLLAECGVFVFDHSVTHVHMERGDSRMRAPVGKRHLAARSQRRRVVLHWRALVEPPGSGAVDVVDAVAHAVRCQEPRYAIATLDSALNTGCLSAEGLERVFDVLPSRYRVLRGFVDARAQAGTETLVRLMLLRMGCAVDLQVGFAGVGAVDLVVDGWLVVECDSKQFHSSWEQQLKDYRRDRALAALGYSVLRLTAEDILYRPEIVLAALRGLVTRVREHAAA